MTNSFKKSTTLIAIFAILTTLISGYVLFKPFGKNFPSVSLFSSCSADNIAGAAKVESKWSTKVGTELIVQGWSADSQKESTASSVTIQLVDSENNVVSHWEANYDTDRPDVAGVFSNPALARSGMNINIGSITTPGEYKIQLGSVNQNQYQVCTFPILIQVSE